jgi:hypothetical protein
MRQAILLSMVALAISGVASAQDATNAPANTAPTTTAPAREAPRPQDIDPAVNTSSPSQTPETPRPQDVDPAVNTSGAAPANEGTRASSPVAGDAARSGSSSRPTTSGAATSGTSSAATSTSSSTPNRSGANRGRALDRLELDTTQITGNRELPKVLYIVPWKRADLGDLVGRPVNSLLDEVLTPVDRDVFKRENRYYRALTPGETPPANGNPAPPSAPQTGTPTPDATSSGSAAPASRDER